MRVPSPAGSVVLLLSVVLAACTPEHREVRLGAATPDDGPAMPLGATAVERFGLRRQQSPSASQGPSFDYEIPEGWEEAPSSAMRPVNLVGPGVQAWVTQLAPGAGGVLDNVNRWRRQVSLPPIAEDGLEGVEGGELLGEETLCFDLTADDRSKRLVGHMLFADDRSVFVRITGTADAVAAELPAFEGFVASLKDEPAGGGPAAGSSGGLVWSAPDDWQALGDDSNLRIAHYQVAPGVRIWSTILGGNGGGVAMNIGRWCRQYGKDMPSSSEIANLPTLPMLGQEAVFVDLTHDDEVQRGMFGVICLLGERSVFVKMEGPSAVVREQEAAFRKFCEDLQAE